MYSYMSRIGEFSTNPTGFICFIVGLVLAAVFFYLLVVPIHNYIKYRVVVWCGDTEMAESQFNTMSPIVNFSSVGFISTIVLGMGYGRPVYFDMHNFRRPGVHTCMVSFAGVAVYFFGYVLNFIIHYFLKLFSFFSITDYREPPVDGQWYVYAYYVFFVVTAFLRMYCIFSFIFNLIPFGPLDMADVLYMFLPVTWSDALRNNQTFTSFLLFLAAFLSIGKPTGLIPDLANDINRLFNVLIEKIF